MANVIPPHSANYSPGLASYNISLNFSSFGSLLSFPTRLLSRIRHVDDVEEVIQDIHPIILVNATQEATKSEFAGPWSFFNSSYMLGLLLMAVLMHRIPNMVVPPRIPPANRRDQSFWRRVYSSVLPLDLSRTRTRLLIHLPSLYLICRALLLWVLVLLQTSNLFPSCVESSGIICSLGRWSEVKEMRAISWATFCAVCLAFCVEGFARGLDGSGFGFGAHMHANTSPFNLVGYAFLLHIYSSPMTHVNHSDGLPSRPDKHVIVTITIPLFQLVIFHFLSVHKRFSNHRLIPTALTSFLSLLHFHMTLLSHSGIGSLASLTPASAQGNGTLYSSYASPTGTANYPLLNYIPNIFESLLLLTICMTVLLNIIFQVLLTGAITRPLLGLGLTDSEGRTTGGWSWSPPWGDDFGIVLLRIGTASLEATGLRGWGNEVGGIIASSPALQQKVTSYGTVQMSRIGALNVTHGMTTFPGGKRKKKSLHGWNNEVRSIDVGGSGADAIGSLFVSNGMLGIPRIAAINIRWIRAFWNYSKGMWFTLRGLASLSWNKMKGRKVQARRRERTKPQLNSEVVASDDDEPTQDERVYQQFLEGEDVSDDEGAEWDGESASESDDEGIQNNEVEMLSEAVDLYSDLGTYGGATSATMVAHVSQSGGSYLTRRQYSSMLAGSDTFHETEMPLRHRPPSSRISDDSRHNCVICTAEPREIICWPCRCLAMCDSCRENLAAQSSASKHRCPCCRQTVDGYSRIFIP